MKVEQRTTTDWVHLVRAEYREMPGLQLTRPQIQRLWGFEPQTGDAVLRELLETHVLRRTQNDGYVLDGSTN